MSDETQETGAQGAPIFSPTDSAAGDRRAKMEAVKMAAGDDLELDGKKREHRRHQSFRDHVNLAVLIIIWLIVISICLGIAVFAWHLLTPICWHFLDEKALDKLQTILGAAVLSSALTGYANRRMNG